MVNALFIVKYVDPEGVRRVAGVDSFDQLIDFMTAMPKNANMQVSRLEPFDMKKAKEIYFHGVNDAQEETSSTIYNYHPLEWAYYEGVNAYLKSK